MALSADVTTLKTANRGLTRDYAITNAATPYFDGLVGLTTSGYLSPWTDAATTLAFLGLFKGFEPAIGSTGSLVTTGSTSATPIIKGKVDVSGQYLYGVDVTGVSTRASIGAKVYCGSDDTSTLTLTPSVFVGPVGVLEEVRSASDQDVRLYTPDEYRAIVANRSVFTFYVPLATIADGDIVTTFTPGYAGRIVKWFATVATVASTASKGSTLNLEVGTTNLTGGTIVLTTSLCSTLGATIASAAITAGTAFGATDTISIEAASTTTFGEGAINVHIVTQAD